MDNIFMALILVIVVGIYYLLFFKGKSDSPIDKKLRIASWDICFEEKHSELKRFINQVHPDLILKCIAILEKDLTNQSYRDYLSINQRIDNQSLDDERFNMLLGGLDYNELVHDKKCEQYHLIKSIHTSGLFIDFAYNGNPRGAMVDLPNSFDQFISMLEKKYSVQIDKTTLEKIHLSYVEKFWAFIKDNFLESFFYFALGANIQPSSSEELNEKIELFAKSNNIERGSSKFLFVMVGLESLFFQIYCKINNIPTAKEIDSTESFIRSFETAFPSFSKEEIYKFLRSLMSLKWCRDKRGKYL